MNKMVSKGRGKFYFSFLRATIFQRLGSITVCDLDSLDKRKRSVAMKNFIGKDVDKFKLQNRIFQLFLCDPERFIELLSHFMDQVGSKNRKTYFLGGELLVSLSIICDEC